MQINKKVAVPLLTVMLVGTTLYASQPASAAVDWSKYPSFAQRIAERFGLKVAEVKTFFDQQRQERQADALSEYTDFLSKAVANNELTEDQKSLLLAKKQEQQATVADRQPGAGDREARRAEMQARRDEMTKWAKDNSIDLKYLFVHEGRGEGRGEDRSEGRGMGRGERGLISRP